MVKQIPTAVFPGKNAEPQTTTALVDTQRRITPEWRRWTEFVDISIRRFARFFTFLALEDTPDSYSGQAGKGVRVNPAEDALEFYATSSVEKAGFGFNTTGLFSDNEEIGDGICDSDNDIIFPSASRSAEIKSDIPAAATAVIHLYPVSGGIEGPAVGTVTFAAGGATGTIAWTPNPYTLPAGTKLRVRAPSPRDATLYGVTGFVPGDLQ
jgi:hypothetical protein